ncbi:MAG: thymidine kinase [Spirochaetales bacterium]|nr:thymidine kinase [Spirochaetales bacterium]
MTIPAGDSENASFLKSLGFPQLKVHKALSHFDFIHPSRRILVIGPMGSGKTEYSARILRDSRAALNKSGELARQTTTQGADRRYVFFVRSSLDQKRFTGYPPDALAYRGGYERCGEFFACIKDSFELEEVADRYRQVGTWIIDEASFFDERLAYVIRNLSEKRGLNFIFPTLILNFRKEIFNPTAQFLLEASTDVFPLTAYCEHSDCLLDSYYTFRYYMIDGLECPALYFDPLIIIGGDKIKDDALSPNYCTRCDAHHYLPGKEYTFLILKPLGERASQGDRAPLRDELHAIIHDLENSRLFKLLKERYLEGDVRLPACMNSLKVPRIAEKALIYLFAEQNLITEDQLKLYAQELELDLVYLSQTLTDNRRPVDFAQLELGF